MKNQKNSCNWLILLCASWTISRRVTRKNNHKRKLRAQPSVNSKRSWKIVLSVPIWSRRPKTCSLSTHSMSKGEATKCLTSCTMNTSWKKCEDKRHFRNLRKLKRKWLKNSWKSFSKETKNTFSRNFIKKNSWGPCLPNTIWARAENCLSLKLTKKANPCSILLQSKTWYEAPLPKNPISSYTISNLIRQYLRRKDCLKMANRPMENQINPDQVQKNLLKTA